MIIDKTNALNYGIIAEEGNKSATFAADELKKYIELSCGFKLQDYNSQEYFISLGNNTHSKKIITLYNLTDLNEDGFYFVTRGDNFYIFADSDKGLIFGVYEFLERYLGVKFLNLDCEHVPKNKRIEINEKEKKFRPYSGQRTYLAYSVQHDANMNLRYKFTSDYGMEREDLGLHSKWYAGIPFGHNSNYYVPKEVYQESHPEFFSTNKYGDFRVFDTATELCYTNGVTDDGDLDGSKEVSVAKIAAAALIKFMEDDKSATYFMFGKLDNGKAICHCQRCEAARKNFGGEAGVMIIFLNAVLKEARNKLAGEGKVFDRKMVTFAYSSTVNPPLVNGKPISPRVIPDKDLHIRFAPIAADYTYAMLDPQQKEDVKMQFAGWTSLTQNIMIWDYNNNYSEYFWYFANLSYMKENLKLYSKLNLSYIMKQGANNIGPIWFDEMKCYVCSKLFWDLSLSVDKLVKEYCEIYFGIGGKKVYELVNVFERFFKEKIDNGFHLDLGQDTKNYFKPNEYPLEFLQDCEKLVHSAIADVENSDLSEIEKNTYIKRLKSVLITPVRMIVRNKDYYFPDGDDCGYENEFFALANAIGLKMMGEVVPIYIDFVSNNASKYKIVTGQTPTDEELVAANYLSDCIFVKAGVRLPIVKDSEVFPAYWEYAIMVGKNTMTNEFYKGGIDISGYEYFVDIKGWCVFIDSEYDIMNAIKVFISELVRDGDSENSLEIVAKKRIKNKN